MLPKIAVNTLWRSFWVSLHIGIGNTIVTSLMLHKINNIRCLVHYTATEEK